MKRRALLATLALGSVALAASFAVGRAPGSPLAPELPVAPDAPATRIVIDKTARTLTLVYPAEVHAPIVFDDARFGDGRMDGPKREQGDERTPEGVYRVSEVRTSGPFRYLPSLLISYPGAADRRAAKARGVDPGGAILIHSPPKGWPLDVQPPGDWTDGCISLTRAEAQIVVESAWVGLPVEIRP